MPAGRSTLRSKEEAYDYRYFLEPDLVPLVPDAEWILAVADTMGPMPAARRSQLVELLGGPGMVTDSQVDQVATVVDLGLDPLVTAAVASGVGSGLALARTANEAANDAESARRLDPESYVALLTMEGSGALTATQSKTVLSELLAAGGGDPAAIASAKGFEAMSEDSLAATVAEVVAAHPDEWARYCAGEDKLHGRIHRHGDEGHQWSGRWQCGGGRAPSPTGLRRPTGPRRGWVEVRRRPGRAPSVRSRSG